ncbi:hypothetical protein LTR56_005144 [Elasticomyces elasticus]|nr:hypothetical protein LTR56_005144 [Elasticomyces elasticus]KAK3659600.1 hypothetical protein LTR22_008330 [Elasticomyces elasticus]KAK4921302.1 hypothetical protein LTR49_011305 [Elasticomyces elasticus]KAK5759685.1 hypothetical protein LTS12_010202 [Elasticomyces elasticus]
MKRPSAHQVLLLVSATLITGSAAIVDLNRDPPQPQPTICGDIVSANLEYVLASDAIDCLTSIPFNAAVASRFLQYYNETLQFQSTLAYLKDPPVEYQQPAVDVVGGLQNILEKVNNGYYLNQYAFEADVQSLSQRTHDSHTTLYAGVMNEFTFASPFYLVSVSPDGKQAPSVYIYGELVECRANASCVPSPITTINTVPVVDYLSEFARNNSFGMVEPHADWNQLFVTPAQLITGSANAFSGGATFYPGDEMILEFGDNRPAQNYSWLAFYNSPGYTGPLATGGDFYNFFVLNLAPANYNTTSTAYYASLPTYNSTTVKTNQTYLTSWHSVASAYPADTLSHQKKLSLTSSGSITSYMLRDISTAVLSIPTFNAYSDIETFSGALIDFVDQARKLNASKVIIDLQQNTGGLEALAFEVFRQFFPGVTPFAGSRMRSHGMANILGDTMTRYFQNLPANSSEYEYYIFEDWVVTDRLNAQTGQNFSSWAEFFGPRMLHNDTFSLTEQYNLSSQVFAEGALNIDFPDCYYNRTCDSTAPWAPENITLLTDGTCTSTCALFVEMMRQDAGVHVVVIGDRPEEGPMQSASGSRGALSYSSDQLDGDMWQAGDVNDTAAALLPQIRDPAMQIWYAGVNLRDQIRPNATIPNQFRYLPADCRLYWTFANFNDYGRLWHDVYDAIFKGGSLCVPGSVNVTSPPETKSLRERSLTTRDTSLADYIKSGVGLSTPTTDDQMFGMQDSLTAPAPITFCENRLGQPDPSLCAQTPGAACAPIDFPCGSKICKGGRCNIQKNPNQHHVCVSSCKYTSNNGGFCNGAEVCQPLTSISSIQRNSIIGLANPQANYDISSGLCLPQLGNWQRLSCNWLFKSNSHYQEMAQGRYSK